MPAAAAMTRSSEAAGVPWAGAEAETGYGVKHPEHNPP
jgi:hypothetical protein